MAKQRKSESHTAKRFARPKPIHYQARSDDASASARVSSEKPHPPPGVLARILRNNGLSIALALCFLSLLLAQSVAGHRYYNDEQREHGAHAIGYVEYVTGPHFLAATMENWESEFLQMFMYVLITVFLFQKGSAESKHPDREEEVDRDPRKSAHDLEAPGPVRRGGIALKLYENSLSLAFLILFLLSFGLHVGASLAENNEQQLQHGGVPASLGDYLAEPRFWFESFQNWQSEFLAVLAIVVLTIFLRQRGSPESKPVDAKHSETGSG
jgi:hypothetical protein